MSQTGYTPIQLYYSTTAAAAPSAGNLAAGELAINITDGKLYYKDNGGVVQTLAVSPTATGTANGVLYLNGSKVPTAGTALTFDGTNFGVGGFVRATSTGGDYAFRAIGSGKDTLGVLPQSAGNGALILAVNAAESTYTPLQLSGSDLRFLISGSEQMRLTSTGLGIGTSLPADKLQVLGTIRFGANATYYGTITHDAASTGANIYNHVDSGGHLFQVGGTTLMNLTASGNLGLGVTPAAKFNIGSGGAARFNRSDNATYGEIVYGGAGVGMKYSDANSDGHRFFNGSTQAMTLDASGNLLVGTTSSYWGAANRGVIEVNGASTSIFGLKVGGSAAGYVYHSGSDMSVWNLYNNAIQFGTNNTERARIDSSGNLLVGTTTAFGKNYTAQSANSIGLGVETTGSSYTSNALQTGVYGTAAGTGFNHIACINSSATVVFKVLGNGNAQNTNNSYGAISDIKLKENVVDATPKLEKLNQVRVVNYNLIGETQKQIGVVAQELEQIFPSMIEETSDKDAEGNDLGTTTKSVKYSVFVPMLIKALQEQQAIIETLTARITALEGK